MTTKYELSLDKNYVPDWTVTDGIRELFQNALDQQTVQPDNDMFFDYDADTEVLRIGNKQSVLEPKTLLIGSSTKADDDRTIGKFGEGYKVACLVLLREGKTVTFYNYGKREIWRPRFVKSRKYGGLEILVFGVTKDYFWAKVPDNNLTIEVGNINAHDYKAIVESNLRLKGITNSIETDLGRILLDEDCAKKVFVNGLFVCEYDAYHKGYDFIPKELPLGRDRKLVDNFKLQWLASKMWARIPRDKEYLDIMVELISKLSADVTYVNSYLSSFNDTMVKAAELTYDGFVDKHGDKAVPVTTQDEADKVPEGYKAVITNTVQKEVIEYSPKYTKPVDDTPVRKMPDLIEAWFKEHEQSLSKRAVKELKYILEVLTDGN